MELRPLTPREREQLEKLLTGRKVYVLPITRRMVKAPAEKLWSEAHIAIAQKQYDVWEKYNTAKDPAPAQPEVAEAVDEAVNTEVVEDTESKPKRPRRK